MPTLVCCQVLRYVNEWFTGLVMYYRWFVAHHITDGHLESRRAPTLMREGEKRVFRFAHAAQVLGNIDDYYADQRPRGVAGVATQLARQLADPRPADRPSVGQLSRYKGLEPRWTDWDAVVEVCRAVATGMVTQA